MSIYKRPATLSIRLSVTSHSTLIIFVKKSLFPSCRRDSNYCYMSLQTVYCHLHIDRDCKTVN